MQLRLLKLQNNYIETKKLRSKKLLEAWEDMESVFYYQGLLYILEIIQFQINQLLLQ